MIQNKVVPPQETLLPLSEYNAEGNTVESVCPGGQCANAPQKQSISPVSLQCNTRTTMF